MTLISQNAMRLGRLEKLGLMLATDRYGGRSEWPALDETWRAALKDAVFADMETILSAVARKFADVFVAQAAWAVGRSSFWASRSGVARVNFHWNGLAICS